MQQKISGKNKKRKKAMKGYNDTMIPLSVKQSLLYSITHSILVHSKYNEKERKNIKKKFSGEKKKKKKKKERKRSVYK